MIYTIFVNMKQTLLFFIWLVVVTNCQAQTIDANYVKALYAKYPTVKSNFCPACKEWDNPYFKSIADTQRHIPLVEHEILTKANCDKIPLVKIPRTGIYAAWHPVLGQPDEQGVYTAANVIVKKNGDEIAKGHVMAWIWNAYDANAAIFSDTYTFNAALQDQSENVGTKIAVENLVRGYLKTGDVEVWGGTYGSQGTFTDGKVTDVYPAYYWHIIKHGAITDCYWLPNLKTETQVMLPKRVVTFQQLISNLGFDPTIILK